MKILKGGIMVDMQRNLLLKIDCVFKCLNTSDVLRRTTTQVDTPHMAMPFVVACKLVAVCYLTAKHDMGVVYEN